MVCRFDPGSRLAGHMQQAINPSVSFPLSLPLSIPPSPSSLTPSLEINEINEKSTLRWWLTKENYPNKFLTPMTRPFVTLWSRISYSSPLHSPGSGYTDLFTFLKHTRLCLAKSTLSPILKAVDFSSFRFQPKSLPQKSTGHRISNPLPSLLLSYYRSFPP